MVYLEWSKKYTTGISPIDKDHKNLFAIVNALYDAVHGGHFAVEIEPTLMTLSDYTKMHFAREEKIMARYQFPGLESHAEKHRTIARHIQMMINDYRKSHDNIEIEKLLAYMKNWLTGHVLKSDMEYVPYITDEALPTPETVN